MNQKLLNLKYPQAIVFDCYGTLFENSTEDWIITFGEIIKDLHLDISKENLWGKWKFYEVNFRKNRTNIKNFEKSPKFINYREAWTDCFKKVFNDLNINSDHLKAGFLSSMHMTNRPIFPETLSAISQLYGKVKLGIFSNADEEGLQPLIKNSINKYGVYDAYVINNLDITSLPLISDSEIDTRLKYGNEIIHDIHSNIIENK